MNRRYIFGVVIFLVIVLLFGGYERTGFVLAIILPFGLAFWSYKFLKDKKLSYASMGAIVAVSFAIGQILAFAYGMWVCSGLGCAGFVLLFAPISAKLLGELLKAMGISSIDIPSKFLKYFFLGFGKIVFFALIGAIFGWKRGRRKNS